MPFTLTMPKLSPTMNEGTITKWHKKVGDFIEDGDLLFEVATDKATVEYNALDSGWLRKIILTEGRDGVVNQPVAVFTENKDESIEGYQPEGESSQSASLQPNLAENIAIVAKDSSPTSSGSAAPIVGVMRQPSFAPEAPLEGYEFSRPESSNGSRRKVSPLARKLAKEKGLDLSTVKGSGPGNRITSKDLSKAQPAGLVTFGRNEMPSIAPGSFTEQSLTPMRKVISQRLQEAKASIPHFYVSMKIDAEPLIQAREQLKKVDLKVTFNDFIVRASALALRQHPQVNSGFNSFNNSIVRFQTVDISVAVSLPEGLITPIVRHADFKNLGEISLEVKALAVRAKEGKLAPHEYKGGSFTISNLGMYGVSEFIAIINPPQAAIVAVSGMEQVAVVRDGKLVPGTQMTLTLSGDHRVIDGVIAAEFLVTLKKLLENPAALLV